MAELSSEPNKKLSPRSTKGPKSEDEQSRPPKYSQALKTLCPVRCTKTPENTLPLDENGFLNYMTFGWLTSYMWRVYRRGAGEITGLRVPAKEDSDACSIRLDKFWQEEVAHNGTEQASFGNVLFRAFKTRFIIGFFVSVISAFLVLANPIFVIRYFLDYLQTQQVTVGSGIIYAVLLALIIIVNSVFSGFFWMLNFEAAARIKYGSLALLYKKVLRVKSFKDKTVGDLINIISNDSQRIWDAIIMGPFITGAPIYLITSFVYGIILLGPWAILGWFITLFFFPFAGACAKMSMKYREASIKFTDKRVGLITEVLTCVKLIKMYAWEECFGKRVVDIRHDEQDILTKSVFTQSLSMGSSMLIPIFASCLTFIAYVNEGNNLTPSEAFTFVSLLNTLQGSLMAVAFSLKSLTEVTVTNARIKEVLLLDEMKERSHDVSDSSLAVEVLNANCSWSIAKSTEEQKDSKKEKKKKKKGPTSEEELTMADNGEDDRNGQICLAPVLRNITFNLKKGDLLGVCGHVGCGKTSLISALLGRMDVLSGSVAVSGTIAFVSQQAWITNDTIKNNILFGQNYDEDRYKEVLRVCDLTQDLDSLAARDDTEVGERGTTLSGGQKQRISLARAAYSNCDLIFLDDPLSSVDTQVGHHIFEHCINGLMKDRTAVLVTHQLQYLEYCSKVMVMKEGSIIEQGHPEELLTANGEYACLLELYHDKNQKSDKLLGGGEEIISGSLENVETPDSNGDAVKHDLNEPYSMGDDEVVKSEHEPFLPQRSENTGYGQLTEEEEMEEGAMSSAVIGQYIQALGGFPAFILLLFFFALPVAGVTLAGWYLQHWLAQGGGGANITVGNYTMPSFRVVDHPERSTYLIIYAIFIPVLIVTMLLRSLTLTKATIRAATSLHNNAFTKVMRCPMAFFDSTPLGRIVNRFSADQDEIDMRLPMNAEIFLTNVLQMVAGLIMIAYVSPWFLIAVVPFGILFFALMIVFHTCVTVMKRVDNVTRSPILSHMGATVQGVATIQAYSKTQDFTQKHCELLNSNSVPVFLFYCANRWLAVRMDMLSAFIAFLTGLLILLTFDYLNPALAGLALSYSVQMSALFQFTARLFIETEARFTSVQRILKYCNLTKKEASVSVCNTSPEWPDKGSIKFDKVKLRYQKEFPLALSDVTLQIAPHEKIGIVGRTGSGKSSLTAAIFRLVELEEGHIYIDDQDISNVDLKMLRSQISIIPQDPMLFTGTLRYNMDPLEQYSDADIWGALSKCYMKDLVNNLEKQLDTEVEESGGNFSIGEKQLFCMARALLRNSKILILDEATAAIDTVTDALVQKTLKDYFVGCTILTIAHRINTVTNCDKVLVMDDGKVQEFDTLSKLLEDPNSRFKAMIDSF